MDVGNESIIHDNWWDKLFTFTFLCQAQCYYTFFKMLIFVFLQLALMFLYLCVYNVCILFVWGFLLYFSYFLFLVAENKPERTWHICSIFCWWEESGRLENITNLVMWHHPATCLALYIAESKRKTQQYALIFYVFALVYNFVIGMALTIIWHTFQDEKNVSEALCFLVVYIKGTCI